MMALIFAKQPKAVSFRTYSDTLDHYAAAFSELAKAEGVALLEGAKLRRAMSKYSIDEIERAYDACCRFGIQEMYQNLIVAAQ